MGRLGARINSGGEVAVRIDVPAIFLTRLVKADSLASLSLSLPLSVEN